MKTGFSFKSKIWLHDGLAGWHFITLPKNISLEIKEHFGNTKKGWGSVPIEATIGKTSWRTSIFPDSKIGTYLLPVKKEIRKKENIKTDQIVNVQIQVLTDLIF